MNADFEDADLGRVYEAREAGGRVCRPLRKSSRYRTH